MAILERAASPRLLILLLVLLAPGCRARGAAEGEIPARGSDRRVLVEVLNGSGRSGLARRAARLLRDAGYDVVYYGNAQAPTDSTLILVRRGSELGEARRVVDRLGAGRVEVRADTLRRVDLSIVLGPEWQPPAGMPP